ncbi:MAG TPA: cadherin-like domain-containing protein, partial [Saprospiraceae bacterium]|nr:cadherin-like domain-containing protein [Saprospiraceae bacterium]
FPDSVFFVCDENNLDIDFHVLGINGYRNPTTLRLENMPPFLTYSFSPQGTLTPDRQVELNISGLSNLPGGTYNFRVAAESTDGNFSFEKLLKIRIRRNVPPLVDFSSPENFSNLNQEFFTLEWPQRANTDHFRLQLSRNEDFSDLILDTLLPGNQINFTQVTQSFSAYYCRIRSENACAVSTYSPVLHLRSRAAFCRNYLLEGEWPILSGSAQTLSFETQVSESFTVTQVELANIKGEHDNTGILEFNLVYPDNSRRNLLSFPCPGETEYLFGVSSRQATPVSCPLNRGLVYESEANLAGPLPQNSNGAWALEIINNDRNTGGIFYGYEINLCGDAINRSNEIEEEANEPLQVFTGKSGLIVEQLLLYSSGGVSTSDIVIIPERLPSHGELLINGNPLAEGEWFDQQTILNHDLVYQHDGSQNLNDDFIFSVLVSELGILENQRFDIDIQNNSLDGTAFITQPMDCPNENNAEVKIEARGGLPPYVFGIQGFAYQTDSLFRGLSPGSYVFTLEDQSGIEIALPIVRIADIPDFVLEVEQEARTAIIHLTGGTAPYEYSLNGALFTEDSVFTDMGNGSQRLTIQDAKGCRETLFFWFEFIPVRGEITNTETPSCHDSRDGLIAISAHNGLPPFRFSIDDGPFEADSTFTDLGPGIYQIKILDALGEIYLLDGIELENPDPIAVGTNVIDRDIFVNATGGTGQFLYSLNGGNFTINSVFRDVPIGTQEIEVRDQNNCRSKVEVQVTDNPLELDYEILAGINCHGDSTGILRIIAQGGTPPYEFSLHGGPFREGNVFDALPAATYRVDVRDTDGQLQTINGIVIEEPDELNLTITVETDTVIARASGGIAPYEYALDNGSFERDSLFTGVNPGLHTVRVLDANNCAVEKEFSVDASNLNLSLNIVSQPSCFEAENGIIMVNASGGVAPYEYSLDNVEYQESAVFTGLIARNYVAYVRDALGTVGISNVVRLASPPPLLASIAVRSDSILIDAFGGTGTILTSLDGSPFDSVYLYHSLEPGEYEVRLLDENDCRESYTVEVEPVNNPELSLEDIDLFPNPFQDHFQLRLPSQAGSVNIQVLDALGRQRFNAYAKPGLLVIPTRDWTPGVYFIHLESDGWDQPIIQKIIKG